MYPSYLSSSVHLRYGEASPMNGDHAPAGIWRDLQVPDASKYGTTDP